MFLRSLVKQLAALRRKLGNVADEDDEQMMCGLLMALTSSVSALKEGKHEAVLSEVLSIKLWSCCQVTEYALLGAAEERGVAETLRCNSNGRRALLVLRLRLACVS